VMATALAPVLTWTRTSGVRRLHAMLPSPRHARPAT
jgi:hypothetical protein